MATFIGRLPRHSESSCHDKDKFEDEEDSDGGPGESQADGNYR